MAAPWRRVQNSERFRACRRLYSGAPDHTLVRVPRGTCGVTSFVSGFVISTLKESPVKAMFIRSAAALAVATAFALPVSLLAATPKDTLVVTWAIDDIITMDPGEAFEISAGEIMGN